MATVPTASTQHKPYRAGTQRRYLPWRLLLLPIVLVTAVVAAELYGSVSIPKSETLGILLAQLGVPTGHTWPRVDTEIVWSVRLPRVVAAMVVGVALSIAGVILQAILRNPLADPYVIGTSSGAALGAAVAIALPINVAWHGFGAIQLLAFLGAIGAVTVVYGLARVGGRTPLITLLLAGFAVSTLLVAGVWLIVYVAGSGDQVMRWVMGGLGDPGWDQMVLLAPLLLALSGTSLLFVRDLNVMLLGEEQAAYLGVDVEQARALLIVLAALLTALAVSASGIVGFVGLVIPHIGRLLYGPNHRILIPASACLGATFLVLADLAARTLAAPSEIPLGVLTAVIGVPFFMYLLRRSRYEYRF
jgi:iron complex transport system permease protein